MKTATVSGFILLVGALAFLLGVATPRIQSLEDERALLVPAAISAGPKVFEEVETRLDRWRTMRLASYGMMGFGGLFVLGGVMTSGRHKHCPHCPPDHGH